jgi:hypothetical protein
MTPEEWNTEGQKLFGENKMKWRFVCPACGFKQTVQDYKDAGAPPGAVGFSCLGRWQEVRKDAFDKKDKRDLPCNYAGGGLINYNPVEVDGRKYFAFAPYEEEPKVDPEDWKFPVGTYVVYGPTEENFHQVYVVGHCPKGESLTTIIDELEIRYPVKDYADIGRTDRYVVVKTQCDQKYKLHGHNLLFPSKKLVERTGRNVHP